MTRKILLADDESLFAATTAQFLRDHGFDVTQKSDGLSIQEDLIQHQFDLIVTDLDMPGNRNLELLTYCRCQHPIVPIIVVTGRPSLPSAIESIRLGIHDYILKPIELDDLLHSIARALPESTTESSHQLGFSDILGNSEVIQRLKKTANRISHSQATVLIKGESGTGKELLARGIHAQSRRHQQPMVTVDCGSISESLVESILFGHVKGAFTGADRDHVGLVEAAHQGTLFLDEIGELPLLMQAKLLRALQFGTFMPVGSTLERSVDIRIIAATNRDLSEEVRKGAFREDLYYRIGVLEVEVPPLRNRIEDVELLTRHFIKRISHRDKLPPISVNDAAWAALKHYRWPGNVRELYNVVERSVCHCDGYSITAADVRASFQHEVATPTEITVLATKMLADDSYPSLEFFQEQQERCYVESLMERHNGNVAKAAREANITRQGLHKMLLRLGISPKAYR